MADLDWWDLMWDLYHHECCLAWTRPVAVMDCCLPQLVVAMEAEEAAEAVVLHLMEVADHHFPPAEGFAGLRASTNPWIGRDTHEVGHPPPRSHLCPQDPECDILANSHDIACRKGLTMSAVQAIWHPEYQLNRL